MQDLIKTQKLYNGEVIVTFNAGTPDKPKHLYHVMEETGKQKRLVGVTTYLGMINKPMLIPWAVETTVNYLKDHIDDLQTEPRQLLDMAKKESDRVKNEAGDIGSNIHEWIEMYIKNKIGGGDAPIMPEDERVLNGVNNFLDWAKENNPTFEASEYIVYSRKYGYVGQIDIIAVINEKRYLLDIKTSNGVWPEMLAQTAAYRKAYEEETGKMFYGRMILKINKDTEAEHNEKLAKKDLEPDLYPYKIFEAIALDEEEDTTEQDFKCFLATMDIYEWQKIANKHLKNIR